MPSRNARRGANFEREIVRIAREAGFTAERAYGSNGRALGEAETVDILINHLRVQAKRRKRIADYFHIPPGADIVVVKQDRKEPLAVIPLTMLLDLMREPRE